MSSSQSTLHKTLVHIKSHRWDIDRPPSDDTHLVRPKIKLQKFIYDFGVVFFVPDFLFGCLALLTHLVSTKSDSDSRFKAL